MGNSNSTRKINSKLEDKLALLSDSEQQSLLKQLNGSDATVVPTYHHDFSGRNARIGVMSDTHIGSKYFNPQLFDKVIKYFEKKKVDGIYHAGDILEGMSGRAGHIYELDAIGLDAQLDLAIKYLSSTALPIFAITGNHDDWYRQKADIGADVGKLLEQRLHNFKFLGLNEADVILNGTKIKLFHPAKGTAYALSYQGQKLVESFDDKNKPDIVLNGHYHKALFMNVRDVNYFECGTIQNQSGWMRSKNIPAHTGAWIIDIYKDNRIGMEFIK